MSETELWFAQLQKELRVHNPPNDSTHVYYSHTKYEQQTPTGSALTKIQVFFRQFRDLHETFIKETLCKSLTELVVFRSFGAPNLRPWCVNKKVGRVWDRSCLIAKSIPYLITKFESQRPTASMRTTASTPDDFLSFFGKTQLLGTSFAEVDHHDFCI